MQKILNFLAHFYYFKQDKPEYALGLLLPDLCRNFSTTQKLKLNKRIEEVHYLLKEKDFYCGCLDHYESDELFHKDQLFLEINEELVEFIRESDIKIKKDWFVVHILTELLLDQIILKHHKNMANKLYDLLNIVDLKSLQSFLLKHNYTDYDSFESGYQVFLTKRYLNSYIKDDQIIYALGQINKKVGIAEFTEQEKQLLFKTIDHIKPRIEDLYQNLHLVMSIPTEK